MSMQYPIADMFTRIRNGLKARKHSVNVSFSGINTRILELLVREGYVESYKKQDVDNKKSIDVFLKYANGKGVIEMIECRSKPSLRIYKKYDDLVAVFGGLGILVISTSKGVFSDRELKLMHKKDGTKLGGEIIGAVV